MEQPWGFPDASQGWVTAQQASMAWTRLLTTAAILMHPATATGPTSWWQTLESSCGGDSRGRMGLSHVQASCVSHGCGLAAVLAPGGCSTQLQAWTSHPVPQFPHHTAGTGPLPIEPGVWRGRRGDGGSVSGSGPGAAALCLHTSAFRVGPPHRSRGQVAPGVSGHMPPGSRGSQCRQSRAVSAVLLQTPTTPDYGLVATAPRGSQPGTVNPGQLQGWCPPLLLHPHLQAQGG